MSKWVGIIIGALEIGVALFGEIFAPGNPLSTYLIIAGVGTMLSGVGTLIAGSGRNASGLASASRNPVAPWTVAYGRTRMGGTVVYLNEWGDTNKYLDMVIVLTSHPCQSIDALLFDGQRIQLNGGTGTGTSFTPVQQRIDITTIARAKGVVTVQLPVNIPYLDDGDFVIVEGVTSDYTLNGKFPVHVLGRAAGGVTFTYICGGMDRSIAAQGDVKTVWPDYLDRVYMESLLGDHTETFSGMLYGTPNAGLPNPNPWTSDHKLLGKTCVFLRLTYDEKVFSSGIPQISFRLRGKCDIYDPRTSPPSYLYSENAALCIADYLCHQTWGFRAIYGTEVPIDRLIAAANICDEPVGLAGADVLSNAYTITPLGLAHNGRINLNVFSYWDSWPPGAGMYVPTAISLSQAVAEGYLTVITTDLPQVEPRYSCNGQFPLSVKRGEVLQNLLTCCAGRLTYVGGQFVIYPAAWAGVSDVQLTMSPF